jgi:integrase
VNWVNEFIEFRIKSKDPEREYHYLPITNRIRMILDRELGRHPSFVFTFVCRKNRHIRNKLVKGQRYPFSLGGWRADWYNALKLAGLWDERADRPAFRFHDLRHTAATRTLNETDNLKLVQEMLGHSRITTTERYAKLAIRKLRDGMDKADSAHSRHIDDTQPRQSKENCGKHGNE